MKKLVSLLLVAVMVAALFAGSASAAGNDAITIWQANDETDFYVDYNSHPITLYMEEKFGIDLEFQLPPSGGESDAFNLMVSTGEFTDVVGLGSFGNSTAQQLFDDGYLRDLAPYIAQYMPNYNKYLDEHPKYRAAITTEDGRIFGLVMASPIEDEAMWGGMVYRRDILDTMTGGNVSFPSGSEEPATIEDWEYMLDLYYQYFQAAGMADYACLILPASGCFITGDLVSGFGVGSPNQYVMNGEVHYGAQEQGYYNYLAKMAEWYQKGWIYQDFASRVNDTFYLPNTALTYGNGAGIWFGGNWQLGDAMSMPEYGLFYDVQAIATPVDNEHGITESHARMIWTNFNTNSGMGISTNCSEEKMIQYMTAMDYFFSEEGANIVSYGLSDKESATNATMIANGLEEGVWHVNADGNLEYNPKVLDENGTLIAGITDLYGVRFPGIKHQDLHKSTLKEVELKADKIWTACGCDWNYPAEIALNSDQQSVVQRYNTDVTDAINEFTVKVITGQTELNEQTWAEFQSRLESVGVNELKAVYAEAYAAFQAKLG